MHAEVFYELLQMITDLNPLIHEGAESFDVLFSQFQEEEAPALLLPVQKASHAYTELVSELSDCIQGFTNMATAPFGVQEEPQGMKEVFKLAQKILGSLVVTLRHVEDPDEEDESQEEELKTELKHRALEMLMLKKLAAAMREEVLTPTVTYDA